MIELWKQRATIDSKNNTCYLFPWSISGFGFGFTKKKGLNFRAPRDFVDHDFAVEIIRYQKPLNGSCLGIISKKKLSFPPLALVCNRLVHIYVEIKFDGAMMLVAEQVILLEVEKLPKICVGAGQVTPASFLQTGSF
jgi:hypothetical protein